MGDFNADFVTDSADTRYLQSLANELSLQIVKNGATNRPFGSKDPKTWIDLMFVDENDEIRLFKNITPRFRTHHNLIDVEFSLFIPKPPENNFTYRNFIFLISPEDINGFLVNCKWETFLSSDSDLDSLMNCLNTNLQLAIDELAPLKDG